MAITRTPHHPTHPQTTAPQTTPSKEASPAPASPPPSASTASTSSPSAAPAQDHFASDLGSGFVNQLLGLDRDANGQISRQEFAAGQQDLQRISQDGRLQNRAEQSVLRAMMEAYRSVPSEAHLSTNEANATPTLTPTTPISTDAPLVSYAIQEGRLVATTDGTSSTAPLFSAPHADIHQGGLPTTLLATPTANVTHGDDPGDFYCEHMFFSAQMTASAPESSVQTNANGEKLVGFLHVPSDAWMRQDTHTGYSQEQRHAGTRQVIGAALRGYADQIAAQHTDGPIRMMLTGYDQFMYVRNNPTGDFVSHRENLDASMRAAFGDRLVTPEGTAIPLDPPPATDTNTYRYSIRNEDGSTRDILLTATRFPVDDTAINPQSPTSIQQSIAQHAPHTVISMGVAGSGSYKAEHRADSGGLLLSPNGTQQHSESATDTLRLRDNFSLARAIHAGHQP